MERVRQLIEQGEWTLAAREAQAAAAAGASWDAIEGAVLGLYGAGRFREAMQVLQAQLRPSPSDAFALNALGCVAFELGAPQSAMEILRRSVQSGPSFSVALANLGIVSRAQGLPAEAAACLKRAQVLDPLDLRIDRLTLLATRMDAAASIPVAAWQSQGYLMPVLSPVRGGVRQGCPAVLTAALEDDWDLKVEPAEGALPLPAQGLLMASVWNAAGLFMKEGRLEWAASETGKPVARLRGSSAYWIQRRQYFRVLSGDFLQAELRGADARSRRLVRDFSAGGLSYIDPDPPAEGSTHSWRLSLQGVEAELPAVVRRVRPSLSGRLVVGVEFLAQEKQVDRLARAVHHHVRRLHSFGGSATH